MHDVAKGFKMKSYNIDDNPLNFLKISDKFFKEPMLVNVNTNRLFWHAEQELIHQKHLIDINLL